MYAASITANIGSHTDAMNFVDAAIWELETNGSTQQSIYWITYIDKHIWRYSTCLYMSHLPTKHLPILIVVGGVCLSVSD